MVVQIGCSLVVIFGGAAFVRSFASLATLDPGFDRRQVLLATVDLRPAAPETAYIAMDQSQAVPRHLLVRGTQDAGGLTRAVAAVVQGIDGNLTLELRVFETIVQESLLQERLLAMLLGFFGSLALLVAAIGMYGLMSLAVSRRRSEIGLRLALGAQPSSVVWMVVRDLVILTSIGLALGAVAGVLSGRVVATLLFDVSPGSVSTWLLAASTLAGAAALAAYLPARRAAHLDPMQTLRED